MASPLNGLGELYCEQGKYTESISLYKRALSIRERALEPYHPDLADTLHGLATLHETQGNLKEAVSLYQHALVIREHALGSQHPKAADTREHLRSVLVVLGRTEDVAQLDTAQQEQAETERGQKTQWDSD